MIETALARKWLITGTQSNACTAPGRYHTPTCERAAGYGMAEEPQAMATIRTDHLETPVLKQ